MLDRKTPPAFQKSTAFPLLKPQRETLPTNLNLTLVQGGTQDVVKVEFVIRAGKWFEKQTGVSYFTAHLIQKGTSSRNSFQIAEAFDQYGVHVEVNAGYDFTGISFYGLTKNVERLLPLSIEILVESVFPEAELEQTKNIYIQGLKVNLEKTSYLASRQLRQNLFGAGHPYGNDASIQDVQQLEQSALQNFYQQQFQDVQVIVSGNISPAFERELIRVLSQLRYNNSIEPNHVCSELIPEYQLVEKPGAIQSSIRFGRFIMNRENPDYPAFLLLNHIFGGYFGSRLMKNIREEKGLTYGIYSSINGLKHHSYLVIGADVNSENRDLTITEIKYELNRLRNEIVPVEEFETARNHLIGSLQSELVTPFAHADKIKTITLHGLNENFYQDVIDSIELLKPVDMLNVALQYFEEESFCVVAAG